ncbi:hypothetical protein SAMD00019534_011370 [Acytostelium subglobosum LB1]|uniref:hypothetical protein n=1 Tax=Acytostelium subglobosum LB1 TaxID=1410327 RepID=UPI0006448821|nr:hypothetical protein SAMD00019534_011370 [Acytostelium subglobosum LB1]GAM17962.1 hypothetical protein SAMD00019534_011370 [Acytostelium subglobosum LB1]|eukprot:XP_012758558.1 hypothetical protein SAMD00019534_011370 [Acytostelium subglobosum LB1]
MVFGKKKTVDHDDDDNTLELQIGTGSSASSGGQQQQTLSPSQSRDDKAVEQESISKIINRDNNLTKSASDLVSSKLTNDNNNNNNNNNIKQRYQSPLAKAQELPVQVVILNDQESSVDNMGDPPPSDDDDEDDTNKEKKKRKKFKNLICSYNARVIMILAVLLIITGISVVCYIFWKDTIGILNRPLLWWALYLDVFIMTYLVASWIVGGIFSLFQTTLYLQQHIYYYIHALVFPLSVIIWGTVLLFVTKPMLVPPAWTYDDFEKYFTTLKAFIFVALFYCGRIAFVKILAAKTNRKAFYSLLKTSLLNEELLEQLSTRKGSLLSQSVSASLKKKKKLGVSQWMEILKNRNNLSGKLHSRASDFSPKDAKKLAKQILKNAARGKDYLVKDDLRAYVKEKHLEKTYNTFGSLLEDRITRDDIVAWVLRVVRSRKTLENRLRDHDDSLLVPISTTILALSFAFGQTLRNIFESLILIFFVRPFEVGDKIAINEEVLFVERIGILFTSFKSTDGKAVYVPNSNMLTARKIENHQRSEDCWIGIDLLINFTTPVEKLYILEAKIDKWIKAQPEKWRNDLSLTFVSIQGTTHITVRFGASIISSWQDAKRWRPIKNEFYFKMKEWVTDLGFETYPAKQTVQLLNYPSSRGITENIPIDQHATPFQR